MDAQLIALSRPAVCQLTCIALGPPYERLPRLGRTSGRPRIATPLLCQQEANKISRSVTRRQVIAVPGEALIATAAISFAGRETSPGYQSINEAISAAADGTVINIGPGIYRERLILDGPTVTLQASPKGSDVVIDHETGKPYEATVYATSGNCTLRGLKVAHRSPSVANNYAVFLQGASLTLEDCDVTSITGSGVGLEGGQLEVSRCKIHNCKQHGIALFKGLDGQDGIATLKDTAVSDNGLNGILVKDGARLEADSVRVEHNAGHGFNLSSGTGVLTNCLSSNNGRSSILLGDDFDLDRMSASE